MRSPTDLSGPALLLVLASAFSPALAEGPTSLVDALRATLRAEHEAGRFDGVALIARGDTLIGEYAFGEANRAFHAPHLVDEAFPVASVTKQWVAVMILQLVEQGKLALDDPLAKHLPQVDRPWTGRVTLRDLLAHTSGLPQPEESIPDFYVRADLAPDAVALAKLLAVKDPGGEAGRKFSYNNADYVYLSAVIETVRGMFLAEALRTSILEPAGMGKTGLIAGREIIAGLPEDYDTEGGRPRLVQHFELANFNGAGAGYSSARDLLAFDRALIANRLLGAEAKALMLDSSPHSGYAALGCWVYPLQFEGRAPLRVVERHGAIGAYNAVNLHVPETGVVVILASNISTFADPQTWNKQGLAYRLLGQVVADGAGGPEKR